MKYTQYSTVVVAAAAFVVFNAIGSKHHRAKNKI